MLEAENRCLSTIPWKNYNEKVALRNVEVKNVAKLGELNFTSLINYANMAYKD